MRIQLRIFFIVLASLAVFASCQNKPADTENVDGIVYQCPMKCEGEKTYTEPGSCPVCKMDITPVTEAPIEETGDVSDKSIFNLTSEWKTQDDETIVLSDLKGNVLVVVMIYTTCKAACPRLVADMRNIHKKVDASTVRYVLVSIDPENDTPERLKAFAIENHMDNEQWTFLQGTEDDVREFSNVLAVKYKQISPIDFSHSNIITVFNEKGVLAYQQEGLGVDNSELVAKVQELVAKH